MSESRAFVSIAESRLSGWRIAASAALAITLLLALAVVPVAAQDGPTNGAITFGASPPNGVWLMNSDGSDQQRIVEVPQGMVFTQASSPDGSEILYMLGGGGNNSLRIVGVDGSNDRQIVPAGGPVSADWSRDGSTVLYTTRFASLVPARVVLIDTDGDNERDIIGLPHVVQGAKLSPDGTMLAFWGQHLMLADVDLSGSGDVQATNIRELVAEVDAGGSAISWSPDGTMIAFVAMVDQPPWPPSWDCGGTSKAQDVFVVEVATGEFTNLTDTQGPANAQEHFPYFSPDGTRIAFAAYGSTDCVDGQPIREYEARNVFVMNVDGTGRQGPFTDFQPQAGSFGLYGGSYPVWLPCFGDSAGCVAAPAPDPDPDPDPAPDPDPDPAPDPDPDPAPDPDPDPDPDASAPVFLDVDPTSVHAVAIAEVAARGITTGCAPDRFCPGEVVTRAQMASFLARSLELEPGGDLDFEDVDPASVHAPAIAAVAEAGITTGCSPGRFCPGEVVTRAQMASFLSRGFGLSASSPSGFVDVPADSVHAPGIDAVAEAGITLGCAPGRFCPGDEVTRDQMASFLFRSLGGFLPGA